MFKRLFVIASLLTLWTILLPATFITPVFAASSDEECLPEDEGGTDDECLPEDEEEPIGECDSDAEEDPYCEDEDEDDGDMDGDGVPDSLERPEDTGSTTSSSSTATTATSSGCPAGVVCLYNPLGTGEDAYDIRKLVGRVIKGILSIIGTLAFLMFIYGGVLWLTSMGDPKRVQKGKDILVWTVAGLGVVFSAYAIVNAVLNALTSGNLTGA